MHGLEVPFVFPRQHVDRDDGICKEICAWTVSTPVVGSRPTKGGVEDAALLVYRHVPSPVVHAGAAFPPLVQPGFVSLLTRARHRMKLPQLCTGPRVKRTRVARRTDWHLPRCRAKNDGILVDNRCTI